jgi:tripartite-type tricarboxylate transporter receptor subunit TctC
VVIGLTALGIGRGDAQSWPQRPVKLIVTLGSGSGVDLGMRMLAERVSKRWGQPVVIENRPGGDALVAVHAFLGADDDHVLLATPPASLISHPYGSLPMQYKPSDIVPIVRGWSVFVGVAVGSTSPANSLADYVSMVKANPGKYNWAGTTGTLDFLVAGWLKKHNLEMARVPYRNPQDSANDLAADRVHFVAASIATLRPQLEAGKIKLIAMTNDNRVPPYPDVQTTKEAGFPELSLEGAVGLFGPRSMAADVREKIATDVMESVSDPGFKERLLLTGQVANPGSQKVFAASIEEERSRLDAVAKQLGITPTQ